MQFLQVIHTLIHLRIRQVVFQLKFRLFKAKYCAVASPQIAPVKVLPCIDKGSCYDAKNFTFLNISDTFHSWSYAEHGMLWTYNLNYMDWLLQSGLSVDEGARWIDKFIDELSENSVGLDPYPIALRGINWIKFMTTHGSCDKWNDSLYSQYTLLTKKLEYHLLGNHLLEDAYSLFIAAIYFSDDNFYNKATKLLRQELKEQLLPDGAHYEQSPMYHCILLDRLLDCYNFSVNNERFESQTEFNDFLKGRAELMLGHLESICYEDGSFPLFNDSALGIAPTPQQLKDYALRLGLIWQSIAMKECGYRKFQNEKFESFVDVGNITASYQPGHSHADTFNYELRINGSPFIIDTGISTYNKTSRRQEERGTMSHNTVSIANSNSSEVWGGFRVGKRAKVKILHENGSQVLAVHDGFGKGLKHSRKFKITENDFVVEDLLPEKAHGAISYIHLAPAVKVMSYRNDEIITNHATISIKGAQSVEIQDCMVSREYNILIPTKKICIKFNEHLSYSISL